MSIVAWDGHTLAADSQLTVDGCRSRGVKIRRGRRNGAIMAWVGEQAAGQKMARWFDAGADPDGFPECRCAGESSDATELIVVLSDGTVWMYEHSPEALQVFDEWMAWGSGAPYALGAMAAGASAIDAVKIASKFDVNCGYEARSFSIKKDVRKAKKKT